MNSLVNLLISALAVIICSFLLPGIEVTGLMNAVYVALVLSLLNRIVKPVLVVLTLPITILTLGLFYLVINVIVVYMAAWIIGDGFIVDGIFYAFLFSITLSIVNSILDAMAGN
jgi:putative membrane protein